MSSAAFYRDLKPFRGFVEGVIDDGHYSPIPDDWFIAVADVVNSTGAVKAGRYHEVNYLGAAVIVAADNAVPEHSLASVFGGDGATLAIPPEAESGVAAALLATRRWGKSAFGLDLRVGIVSMSELTRRGAWLLVAKMEFSPGNDMAMFRGNALDVADDLVKKGDNGRSFELRDPENDQGRPNLDTLSCRWEPLLPESGQILCLIVSALADTVEESDAIYRNVLREINAAAALEARASSPIKLSNLRFRFPSWGIVREAKSRSGSWLINLVPVVAFHLFIYLTDRFHIRVGGYDPRRYRSEMTVNADFRKLKGNLCLVIDCGESEVAVIERYLESEYKDGRLVYGMHCANHAIITCVVPSASENEHVHFIDGGEGGLWCAAEAMKSQLSRADTRNPSG